MFFPEAFASIKSYWFWYIEFIDNSLGVTWKFCPRNFKNSDTDCTISQKKSHSELQKKKRKKGNVAAIWLCKKLWLRKPETFENEWQKREHFLRILFVAHVVNIKLVFKDWYLNSDKAVLFPRNQVICLKNWKLWRAPTTKLIFFAKILHTLPT